MSTDRSHALIFLVALILALASAACDSDEPSGPSDTTAADTSGDLPPGDGGQDGDASGGDALPDGQPQECPPDDFLDTAISQADGEQIVPKVALTDDGSTWFAWYSNEDDNYNVRAQLLDPDGLPRFGAEGLLVSDEQSEMWVTDFSLTADLLGSAIVAFNDTRNGDFDTVAYKISRAGDMLWGENGVRLSTSTDGDVFPKMVVTESNDVVFVWDRISNTGGFDVVVVQRVSPLGDLQWGDGVVIEGDGDTHALRGWIEPAGGDSVIVVWIETPDAMSYERTIMARKLDADGHPVWSTDAVVTDEDSMPYFYNPVLESDGAGGVFVAWQEAIGAVQIKSYLQHIDSNGARTMADGGVALSTSSSTTQLQPFLAYVEPAGELIASWLETDVNQENQGVFAQRFTDTGERGWAHAGLPLVAQDARPRALAGLEPVEDGAVVFYGDWSFETVMDLGMMAVRIPLTESPTLSPTVMSGFQSEKDHPAVSGDRGCGCWLVWNDMRDDAGDIRASFFALEP